MNAEQLIGAIYGTVATKENYVPRNYQTIGGAWTVDTWKKDHVTVQVMDEGYTKVILAPGLRVSMTYINKPIFQEGDEGMLVAIANHFNLEQ